MSAPSTPTSVSAGRAKTVWVALAAGVLITVAKVVASVITSSPALAAEASHSLADNGNDLFLLIAGRRAQRPRDDQHPFGYGREAYFWALLAALGVFVTGAAFSLREGIDELLHPSATTSFTLAYVILGLSAALDLVSFRQSAGQMNLEAQQAHRSIMGQAVATSDPSLRAVFTEDAVSVAGDLFALAGLALSQIIGSSAPQAIAAVLIALVLIRISLRLISRNHDFLVGQPVQPADRVRVESFLLTYPGITAVDELLVDFIGPDQVWVLARVQIARELTASEVTALVREVEPAMQRESDHIYRVDVVPVGDGEQPNVE
jgi:cation diffusion facilitator family transporter